MMTKYIAETQARALSAFIHTMRRDWGVDGILSALAEVREVAPAADVALAAIRAASEPTNRTPKVITLDGPHWRNATDKPKFPPPTRAETCATCYERQHVCRTRWAGDHEFEPLTHARPSAADASEARAALAQLALCRHGVDRDRGRCNDCDPDYRAAKAALRPKHTTTEGDHA